MTYDRNPTDIPDSFHAPAPDSPAWPSHPIAQQIARGLPWLKMYMQAQTKPREIIGAMNLLKRLATEIYKVELAFIGQVLIYLLRRDADWQARVKWDLGGDKAMRKWWRRFEQAQNGEVPQKKTLSEHQRNMSHDCARNISRGPITDHDGLFRLAPITGGHREVKGSHYRPYRAAKPTPVFQPIQITPSDLGFENPTYKRGEGRPLQGKRVERKLPFWLEQQNALIRSAIATLAQSGRRLDAHLFQDWLGHLHDGLLSYVKLGGRMTLLPDIVPLE